MISMKSEQKYIEGLNWYCKNGEPISFDLKPCPFCGRPAYIEETQLNTDSTRIKIVCTGCGVTLDHTQEFATHEVRNPVTGELVKVTRVALNENTIDIWNRRVEG